MPDLSNVSTKDIIAQLKANYVAPAGQALITELEYREIKESDDDDSAQHRGGTRPTHVPINP